MTRHKPALALLISCVVVAAVSGQATPASQTATPPAAQAKWIPPLKADGTVDLIKGKPRRVGNEMVTTLKVRNTSKGALALVTVDEYWYPATGTQVISGDTQRHRALLNPGDVAELTLRSPYRADMARSQYEFKHANGKIKAKEVAKFVDDKK